MSKARRTYNIDTFWCRRGARSTICIEWNCERTTALPSRATSDHALYFFFIISLLKCFTYRTTTLLRWFVDGMNWMIAIFRCLSLSRLSLSSFACTCDVIMHCRYCQRVQPWPIVWPRMRPTPGALFLVTKARLGPNERTLSWIYMNSPTRWKIQTFRMIRLSDRWWVVRYNGKFLNFLRKQS